LRPGNARQKENPLAAEISLIGEGGEPEILLGWRISGFFIKNLV
jgi:hypothetical protein